MPDTKKITELVHSIPDLDDHGTRKGQGQQGKVTGPPWPEMIKVLDGILADGPDGVTAVIDMLREVDNGEDWKARYVLHNLAVYTTGPGAAKRADVNAALVKALAADRPAPIKRFVIHRLQIVGDKTTVEPLGGALADEALCHEAAAALVSIRDGAADTLRKAQASAKGESKVAVDHALALIG